MQNFTNFSKEPNLFRGSNQISPHPMIETNSTRENNYSNIIDIMCTNQHIA